MKIDLSGRVALVTGGAGQLGRAISTALAQCGADVAVSYLNDAARAKALAEKLRGAGRRAMAVQADVTDAESVSRLRDAVTAELGAPDILVANAVGQTGWASILEASPTDYETQFRTCTMHVVLLAKAFVPAMIERRWGRIIGINTECSMLNLPRQSAYASAKRAMDGVLRVLAKEVGAHQITVNQVAPGWMISDEQRQAGTQRQEKYERTVPLGRRGEDRDIAAAVAFLASDLANFISGSYIPVSGGTVMPAI